MSEKETVVANCTFAELMGTPGDDQDKPRVNTRWEVEEDDGGKVQAGDVYYKDLYLTDKAFPWSLKALRAMGFKGDDLEQVKTVEGVKCRLVMEPEEYQGVEKMKVQWINRIGGGVPMKGADRLSFAERMKAQIAAAEAGQEKKEEDEGF